MPNKEDFYETQRVSAGRNTYTCAYCNSIIKIGEPSEVHKYYPEFQGYRTHPKCSDDFLNSTSCYDCDEMIAEKDVIKVGKHSFCKECGEEHAEKERVKKEAAEKAKAAREILLRKKHPLKYALKDIQSEIGLK